MKATVRQHCSLAYMLVQQSGEVQVSEKIKERGQKNN